MKDKSKSKVPKGKAGGILSPKDKVPQVGKAGLPKAWNKMC